MQRMARDYPPLVSCQHDCTLTCERVFFHRRANFDVRAYNFVMAYRHIFELWLTLLANLIISKMLALPRHILQVGSITSTSLLHNSALLVKKYFDFIDFAFAPARLKSKRTVRLLACPARHFEHVGTSGENRSARTVSALESSLRPSRGSRPSGSFTTDILLLLADAVPLILNVIRFSFSCSSL